MPHQNGDAKDLETPVIILTYVLRGEHVLRRHILSQSQRTEDRSYPVLPLTPRPPSYCFCLRCYCHFDRFLLHFYSCISVFRARPACSPPSSSCHMEELLEVEDLLELEYLRELEARSSRDWVPAQTRGSRAAAAFLCSPPSPSIYTSPRADLPRLYNVAPPDFHCSSV